MPYEVVKQDGKWITRNKDTGSVKGTHDTREKAIRQMRLLYMVESGKEPTKGQS